MPKPKSNQPKSAFVKKKLTMADVSKFMPDFAANMQIKAHTHEHIMNRGNRVDCPGIGFGYLQYRLEEKIKLIESTRDYEKKEMENFQLKTDEAIKKRQKKQEERREKMMASGWRPHNFNLGLGCYKQVEKYDKDDKDKKDKFAVVETTEVDATDLCNDDVEDSYDAPLAKPVTKATRKRKFQKNLETKITNASLESVSAPAGELTNADLADPEYWTVDAERNINWRFLGKPTPTNLLLEVGRRMNIRLAYCKIPLAENNDRHPWNSAEPEDDTKYSFIQFMNKKIEFFSRVEVPDDRKSIRTFLSDLMLKLLYPDSHLVEIDTFMLEEGKDYIIKEDENEYLEESKKDPAYLKQLTQRFEKELMALAKRPSFNALSEAEKNKKLEELEDKFTPTYKLPDYHAVMEWPEYEYPWHWVLLNNTDKLGMLLIYELMVEERRTDAEDVSKFEELTSKHEADIRDLVEMLGIDQIEFNPTLHRSYNVRTPYLGESTGEDILFCFINQAKKLKIKMTVLPAEYKGQYVNKKFNHLTKPFTITKDLICNHTCKDDLTNPDNTKTSLHLFAELIDEISKEGLYDLVDKNYCDRLVRPKECHRGPTSRKSGAQEVDREKRQKNGFRPIVRKVSTFGNQYSCTSKNFEDNTKEQIVKTMLEKSGQTILADPGWSHFQKNANKHDNGATKRPFKRNDPATGYNIAVKHGYANQPYYGQSKEDSGNKWNNKKPKFGGYNNGGYQNSGYQNNGYQNNGYQNKNQNGGMSGMQGMGWVPVQMFPGGGNMQNNFNQNRNSYGYNQQQGNQNNFNQNRNQNNQQKNQGSNVSNDQMMQMMQMMNNQMQMMQQMMMNQNK